MNRDQTSSSSRATRCGKIGYLKFHSGGRHFVYDKTTNACIPVSGKITLILDDYLEKGAEAVRRRYADKVADADLSTALACLDNLKFCQGMFQPARKVRLSAFLSSKEIETTFKAPCRNLTLNITEQCNLRCSYCIYSGDFPEERSHSGRRMTWPVAQKSIDHLISRSEDHVQQRLGFYGGEPLLNWNMVKRCIEYARRSDVGRRMRIAINTNLTLLTDEMVQFLVEKDIHLNVSLDGPQPIHDSFRIFPGGKGTYEQVLRRVRKLVLLAPEYCKNRLIIQCTVAAHKDISALFAFFSQHPFTGLEVRPSPLREPEGVTPSSGPMVPPTWPERMSLLVAGYFESLRAGKPVNHRMFRGLFPTVFSRIARRSFGGSAEEAVLKRLCIPGVQSIFVSTDGRFFPCENFSHPDNCIGNVDTGIDFAKVRALLATFIGYCEDACRNCWASRLCSLCFLHSLCQGRISEQSMKESCAQERQNIARAFEWFLYLWENEPECFHGHEFSLHSAVRQA